MAWRWAFVAIHLAGCGALVAYLQRRAVSRRHLFAVALGLRLLALPMLPALSDDGYRYLWDGLVVHAAGESPYALRPSDRALAPWRSEVVFERMNSPGYYSVYPPASQAVFWLSATLYGTWGWHASWWLLKGLLVAAELVGIAMLVRVVGPTRAAFYAWSPLAVVEIAGQGHTEALVVAGLGLVLGGVGGRQVSLRFPWASVGVTIAGLTKLYPFAALPAVWRRDGWPGLVVSVLIGVGLSAWFWAPDALAHGAESLGLFFGTFDEYAAPYRVLKAVLYPLVGAGAARTASVALSGAALAAIIGAHLVDDGTRASLVRIVAVVVVGVTVTSTTLHPWYWLPALYLIPLLELRTITWIAFLSTVAYVGYVIPLAADLATAVGWGGALLWLRSDWRRCSRSVTPRRARETPPSEARPG